ncbi:MAG TPA: S53 family peptidase [Streptosporangiaceae bacterium]
MTMFRQASRSRVIRAAAATTVATGLLVTTAGLSPAFATARDPITAQPSFDCLHPPASCYTPAAFRVAYGIKPLLDRGVDGQGETVVVPEVASPPGDGSTNIRQDLATFDGVFGLPAAQLQVDNSLAHSASPYLAQGEEVEDTEIVHAVAPGAAIRVILFSPSAVGSPAGFIRAIATFLNLGAIEGNVLSISASAGEHYFTPAEVATINAALRADQAGHVTVLASSGDYGAISDLQPGQTTPVKEVSMPASDPLVLAVGGTSLSANRATGAYLSETAWNTLPQMPGGHSSASAGGFSHLFARPSYQNGVPASEATRGVPDVSGDAAFNTGMAIAVGNQNHYFLTGATGTSAATPLWAGIIALADQFAGRPLGFVNPAIYQIARTPAYSVAFHDITRGNNTTKIRKPPQTILGYQATPGWDPVTGWGTPNAQFLVPLLSLFTR